MKVDRPPPGEELNEGEVTPARQAATLVLLRDSPDGPEVLLVQRNPQQRFMGGAWVFPGGALHADDADLAAAAVRELAEEAGIALPAAAELVPWSRWITPEEVKVRFDTWFFVAEAPAGAEATPDGGDGGGWGLGDAVDDAGKVLAVTAGVLLVSAAVLGPLAILAVLIWLGVRALTRLRRERALDQIS